MNHHEPIFYLQANPAQAGLLKELLQRSDYSTHPLLHYREYKSLAQKLRESEGMMGVLFVDPYQQDLAPKIIQFKNWQNWFERAFAGEEVVEN